MGRTEVVECVVLQACGVSEREARLWLWTLERLRQGEMPPAWTAIADVRPAPVPQQGPPHPEPVVDQQARSTDSGLVRDAVRSPLCLLILAGAFVLTVLMLGLGSLLHPDADLGTFRLVVPAIALVTAATLVVLITLARRRRQRHTTA